MYTKDEEFTMLPVLVYPYLSAYRRAHKGRRNLTTNGIQLSSKACCLKA